MGNDKDLEEYEREYLERLKNNEKPKSTKEKLSSLVEPLSPFDYVIMGLIRNGVSRALTFQKRLPKMSLRKIASSCTKLEKRGLLTEDKSSLWKRISNWEVSLTDKGKQEIEKKIDELQEEWDKLVLLYEKKDKEKLREGMQANRNFFPLMMMMGITNGMMMGSMLGMNHMMMGDFMAEVDYAYDAGFADGAAFAGEGGDFGDAGGEGGGFMDGGFQPGF
tara:strand:- start:682 stop:1341 length:660 start_codon:yes stop_codon:yes gene_type:complete